MVNTGIKMSKRHKYYYHRKTDIYDVIIEVFASIFLLIGKLIYKIFRIIFTKHSKTKFLISDSKIPQQTTESTVTEQNSNTKKYTLKESLLTDNEKSFLEVLKTIVANKYIIESQVQLSGIVKPTDSKGNYINYHDFNVIRAKSIDFVLYDNNYKPYLAIELDDSTHLRWDRIKRDQIIDEIMHDVGLRILHVKSSYSYNAESLAKEILS